MASDPTETQRQQLLALGVPQEELDHVLRTGGKVWDTTQLTEDFKVEGFAAPFVVVRRKSDNVKGTLTFTHHPRFYFDFQEVS